MKIFIFSLIISLSLLIANSAGALGIGVKPDKLELEVKVGEIKEV